MRIYFLTGFELVVNVLNVVETFYTAYISLKVINKSIQRIGILVRVLNS